MENLLVVVVHATNMHGTESGILVAREAIAKYPSIQRFCACAGYHETFEQNVSRELGFDADISEHIKTGWEVLTKR